MAIRLRELYRPLLRGGLFLLLSWSFAWAETGEDLIIDGRRFPAQAMDVVLVLLQREDPTLTRSQLLDTLIENHLLARHVREQGLREQVLGGNEVGFDPDVRIHSEFVSTLRSLLETPAGMDIAPLPEHLKLGALLQGPIRTPMKEIARLLPPAPPVYQLDAQQLVRAADIVLAYYVLPQQSPRRITLADIYQRQNVQGRIALHHGDQQWLTNEVQLLLGQEFVLWWARERSGLSADTLAALQVWVEDRHLSQGFLAHSGVSTELHQGNEALRQRARAISRKQIEKWYEAHRERFIEVVAAEAWHIRCASRAPCEEAHAALENGMTFAEAVQRYSIDEDRHQAQPGYLGWLERDGNELSWLGALALMQPPGKPGKPIRAPGGEQEHWEILLVQERKTMLHPVESRTVEMVARQEIAREQLINEFLALRARLSAAAKITRPRA